MKKIFFLYFLLISVSSYGAVLIDGVYYNFSGANASVAAGFPRYSGDVIIPSTVSYLGTTYNVTSIETAAFEESVSLASVTIPNTVTKINSGAFRNCISLSSITVPNSVTLIDNYAFQGCTSLKTVILADGTGQITFSNNTYAKDIFKDCPIETLHLGRNITYSLIYGSPFSAKTTMKNLTIGNQVTEIFYMSFDGCSGLTGELVIPNSVTSIGSAAFRGCSNLGGTLTIPSSVTSIGSSSFEKCSKLVALVIPESVTSIGSSAFADCSSLTGNLNLPNSLSKIENYTFDGCSKLSGTLSIPNGIGTIGTSAFRDCSGFTGLIIPNSVKTIGDYAFSNWKGVTGTLNIPNSVTTIGERAFQVNGAQEIIIGHGLTSIPAFAFNACPNVETVIIGNSVTTIKEYAFSTCSSLNFLTIGKNVLQIDSRSFVNSRSVWEINCKSLNPPTITYISSDGLGNINQSICTLYVQWQSTSKYKSHSYWKNFYQILEKDFSSESDASLSNLTVEGYALTPLFQPNVFNYTSTVPNNVEFVIINGVTSASNATITTSNEDEKYPLNVGDNIISLVVMSEDGTTSTYTITITRETLATSVAANNIIQLTFYPNPAKNDIFVKSELPIEKVEIYSLTGNLLMSESNFNEKISVSSLSQGIYLLKVYTDKGFVISKIMKE